MIKARGRIAIVALGAAARGRRSGGCGATGRRSTCSPATSRATSSICPRRSRGRWSRSGPRLAAGSRRASACSPWTPATATAAEDQAQRASRPGPGADHHGGGPNRPGPREHRGAALGRGRRRARTLPASWPCSSANPAAVAARAGRPGPRQRPDRRGPARRRRARGPGPGHRDRRRRGPPPPRPRQALAEQASRLGQLSGVAPVAGRVEEVFFQPGEWAAANQPILSLLPDAKVKLRFFVPERDAAHYRVGTTVRFTCDGCKAADRRRGSPTSARGPSSPRR